MRDIGRTAAILERCASMGNPTEFVFACQHVAQPLENVFAMGHKKSIIGSLSGGYVFSVKYTHTRTQGEERSLCLQQKALSLL